MKRLRLGVVIIIVSVLGIFGYHYYSETYAATTAYARIGQTIPQKKVAKDDSGKEITGIYVYEYQMKYVTKNGEKRTVQTDVMGTDPKPFQPGKIIQAEVSQKRVVKGPSYINESKVDQKILNQI
ncbi:DUF1093 domain-containing protein [Weissella diestrammenae]|uniref:DUF1093 domain-containing protein n=1 Tax=Weissella diestrammenae TaxID=1162633 RepID=A0A7G9T461_9LACO|nr:DUF1093 domain-containing protein [Weissella diestrammenae]MCM0583410.1 DUF1093 domain-containing protein [Weissella diestrammenae]QNN74886.1 DUF1093 domain-containing protein [Weissella diestrammenae]